MCVGLFGHWTKILEMKPSDRSVETLRITTMIYFNHGLETGCPCVTEWPQLLSPTYYIYPYYIPEGRKWCQNLPFSKVSFHVFNESVNGSSRPTVSQYLSYLSLLSTNRISNPMASFYREVVKQPINYYSLLEILISSSSTPT